MRTYQTDYYRTDAMRLLTVTALSGLIGIGRYPLTLRSAGWGIAFNRVVTVIVSALERSPDDSAHRARFHDFLKEHTACSRLSWRCPPCRAAKSKRQPVIPKRGLRPCTS